MKALKKCQVKIRFRYVLKTNRNQKVGHDHKF
ncbi:hypothetical protein P872_07925 [Rhodonellum psychrophilum GCM71 = DSM 17998]|uniref:Uncharacterized protein n=1 Tax=Rhodonellum psychrophilum GCM71 = DSM 17998 TaxID=1123057 RepID=U5BVN1_9BACT|nr:hypothetical protein P872_07925 [Rhodonellum psychrophilum GCM71 = DSM 17998]